MKIKSFTLLALLSCTPIFGGLIEKLFSECLSSRTDGNDNIFTITNNPDKEIKSARIKKFFSYSTKNPKEIKLIQITKKNTEITIEFSNEQGSLKLEQMINGAKPDRKKTTVQRTLGFLNNSNLSSSEENKSTEPN
jgi:hypothetical protein